MTAGLTVAVYLGIFVGVVGGWVAGHARLTRRAYIVARTTVPGMRKAKWLWIRRTTYWGTAVVAATVLFVYARR